MNVLISSGFRWWNAEAAYAATLAELLREAGHGVWVLAPSGTPNAERLGALGLEPIGSIRPGHPNPLRWPGELRKLADLQLRHRIDVVDAFHPADYLLHVRAARRTPGLRVFLTRGGAQTERNTWLNRKLYGPWCDGVVTSCEAIRSRLHERLGLPLEGFHTIYYPTDLPELAPPEERRGQRERFLGELGFGPERFVIGVVGRIAPEKGHDRLIEAMARLSVNHPEALLLILNKGNASEPPLRQRLERHIRERGLERHTVWLGFRKDVAQVVGWLDVGAIPSVDSELNCRVAVEFMAAGTPIVAFPTGALPEVVEDGVSGLVTPDHSPEVLAGALERLAADRKLLARLAEGAREQAERRFSKAGFLRATLDIFQSAGGRG